MLKRSFALICSLALLLCLFTSPALAGELQDSLLQRVEQPTKQLTRAEFVSLLAQAASLPAPGYSVTLPAEVPADAWYAADLKTALAAGIYNGATPNQPITKAQAITFISRVLGTPGEEAPAVAAPEAAKNHWSYVPYSWLYKDGIVDASFNLEGFLTATEAATLLDKTFGTAQEAKDIVEKSQAAHLNAKTMRTNGDINLSIKPNPAVPVKDMPANLGMKASFVQEVNYDQGISQKFSMTISGLPVPPIEMEQYMVSEGVYMKMPNMQTGQAEWLKMPASMFPDITEMMKQQSQYIKISKELDQYFRYRLVGEKKIGDKTYYEISLYGRIPDLTQFMKLFSGQMGLTPEVMKSFEQSGKLIKDLYLTGTTLINKDTDLTEKQTMTMLVTLADEFEGQPVPLKSFYGNFNCAFKDYGTEINITLPEGAANAQEVPVAPAAVPATPAN